MQLIASDFCLGYTNSISVSYRFYTYPWTFNYLRFQCSNSPPRPSEFNNTGAVPTIVIHVVTCPEFQMDDDWKNGRCWCRGAYKTKKKKKQKEKKNFCSLSVVYVSYLAFFVSFWQTSKSILISKYRTCLRQEPEKVHSPSFEYIQM